MRKLLCGLLLLPGLVWAQPRWIEVDGVGVAQVAPDRAVLQAQVSRLADSPNQAQNEADHVINRVLDAFDAASIPPSRYGAGSLTLGPRYEYRERERVLLGYEARRGVSLEVPVADVGTWLGRFSELGLTEIASPAYIAGDDEAQRRALFEAALEDGLDKANTLARKLDASLGEVLEISEQGGAPMPRAAMMADVAESGRYQPAQQTQQVRLRIKVALD